MVQTRLDAIWQANIILCYFIMTDKKIIHFVICNDTGKLILCNAINDTAKLHAVA